MINENNKINDVLGILMPKFIRNKINRCNIYKFTKIYIRRIIQHPRRLR